MRTIPDVTFPTLNQLKEKYPNTITATENDIYVMAWKEQLPDHQKIVHDVGEELKPIIEKHGEAHNDSHIVTTETKSRKGYEVKAISFTAYHIANR